MPDAIVQSFSCPNYSSMLFNKGNIRTPFSTIIGARRKYTDHVKFAIGQEYETGGGSQPNISETASLTAPDATFITRSQGTNVTQIFQESVGISYAKQSNMGTLSGINVANQRANPMSELDFQVAAKMQKIARDIEFTFMQGAYNEATTDSEVNKSRGIFTAITSNVIDMGGKPIGLWAIADGLKAIRESNAPTVGLAMWCDAIVMEQIHGDAQANGLTIVPAERDVNGIKLSKIITPLGEVYLYMGEFIPAGTAGLFNLGVCAPVEQPVPGKGNFFRELLAKTGAGEKHMIFGQIGLDHGPEWYHAKFTNVSTDFKAPNGKNVYVTGGTVANVETTAVLTEAKLNKNTVAADNTAQVACNTLVYDPATPATAPSTAYLWQIRNKSGTSWTDLTASYTGYNTATLTVKAADAEKHYRCKVTSTGSAIGTVYSDECDVEAAEEG